MLSRQLTVPGMAKVLLLVVVLAVLQLWCGINVIFNYAQEIFAAADTRSLTFCSTS